jgi:hypothetical protein
MDGLVENRNKTFGYLRSYGSLKTTMTANPTSTSRSKSQIKYQAKLELRHRVISITEEDINVELVLRANRPVSKISIHNLSLVNNNTVSLSDVVSNCQHFSVVNALSAPEDFFRTGELVHEGSLIPDVNHVVRYAIAPSNPMVYTDQIMIIGDQIESRESTIETVFKPNRPKQLAISDQIYLRFTEFGNNFLVENSERLQLAINFWTLKPGHDSVYTQFEYDYASQHFQLSRIFGITGDNRQIALASPRSTRVNESVASKLGREFDQRRRLSKKKADYIIRQIVFVISNVASVEHAPSPPAKSVSGQLEGTSDSEGTSIESEGNRPVQLHHQSSLLCDSSGYRKPELLPTGTRPPTSARPRTITVNVTSERASSLDLLNRLMLPQIKVDPCARGRLGQSLNSLQASITKMIERVNGENSSKELSSLLERMYEIILGEPMLFMTDHRHQVVEVLKGDSLVFGYGLLDSSNGQLSISNFAEIYLETERGAIPLNYLLDSEQTHSGISQKALIQAFCQLLQLYQNYNRGTTD